MFLSYGAYTLYYHIQNTTHCKNSKTALNDIHWYDPCRLPDIIEVNLVLSWGNPRKLVAREMGLHMIHTSGMFYAILESFTVSLHNPNDGQGLSEAYENRWVEIPTSHLNSKSLATEAIPAFIQIRQSHPGCYVSQLQATLLPHGQSYCHQAKTV